MTVESQNKNVRATAATVGGPIDKTRATEYETVFIMRADIDSDASEKVISRVLAAIEQDGGKLLKVESWGKRRLSYAIKKQRRGFYVYVRYLGYRGLVAEIERNLRMLDTVLRYMTVAMAKDVNPLGVTVDPEETKIRRLDIVQGDDDKEDSIESSLGLSDEGRHHRDRDRDRDREIPQEYADLVATKNAEAAAAEEAKAAIAMPPKTEA
jgi:small subunit ribosomal protein S6